MPEHLGFHAASPPPVSLHRLPPTERWLLLFWSLAVFFFYSGIRCIWQQNTVYAAGEQLQNRCCLLQLLYSLSVPTHQTPFTHGTDPRGEGAQTSLPHTAPSLTQYMHLRDPSAHTPCRPSALVPRVDSRDWGWVGFRGGENPLSGSYIEKSAMRKEKGCARRIGVSYFYPCL